MRAPSPRLAAALLALAPALLRAQVPTRAPQPTASPSVAGTRAAKASRPATPPERAASLPVTRVALYKNGVGYFEHTGHVTGNANVTIDFTTAQLNDVLQSLTAIDLNGGRISGADYNSTTPLDQQLRSLPIALGEDPTAADFYAAIRGARVEVRGPGGSIAGRLLSVEERTSPAVGEDARPGVSRHFITVVADSGEVRTLELTGQTSVRLLDTALHQDVSRYLELLANNRAQGLRHLTVSDHGTGTRELRVSYISEVPIWKSTYRILFTGTNTPGASFVAPSATNGPATGSPGPTATLQGWAVVDNTVGEDWNNVHLSLIAGAPQSFIQPLSDPIYSRRPEIPLAVDAQLTPQTFDSSNQSQSVTVTTDAVENLPLNGRAAAKGARLLPGAATMSGMAGGSAGGVAGSMAGYRGIGPGAGGNTGGGALHVEGAPAPTAPTYQDEAIASTAVNTNTAAFDDFFSYNIADPITIRKNESALVPILQKPIAAERVTVVSSNGGGATAQPLRALWITNTTGLTLDRGSFSIVENGNFGGEGLLDPIHAGERRLLSYAADQAVHVNVAGDRTTDRVTEISAARGVVKLHRADVHELTFVIHNSAADHRTVITELPVTGGYKLDSDPAPVETTATVYRFRTEVDPGQTVRLHVGGRRQGFTTFYLTNSNDNQMQFLLNETGHNPQFEAALQPILDARRRVYDAQQAVDASSRRIAELRSEEDRERANITALATGDKAAVGRFVRDLNATEDQIKAAQAEQATRQQTLDNARTDLSGRIESFNLDQKLP